MFNIYTKDNAIAIQATTESLMNVINGLLQAGEIVTEVVNIEL